VLSYDAVRVIAAALEEAGDASPQAVRDAIAGIELDSLIAQDGPIAFDEAGENENAAPILMQVLDGAVSQVYPEDYAETEPVYPATSGR
jgi:branched-chain amino acid transport system substrate-binding protein